MKTKGKHVICDLWLLESPSQKKAMEVLNTAIEKSGLNVVGKAFKDFGDEAFTVAFVLSESHFSAHYFPLLAAMKATQLRQLHILSINYALMNQKFG